MLDRGDVPPRGSLRRVDARRRDPLGLGRGQTDHDEGGEGAVKVAAASGGSRKYFKGAEQH